MTDSGEVLHTRVLNFSARLGDVLRATGRAPGAPDGDVGEISKFTRFGGEFTGLYNLYVDIRRI
jgi:hypothetical protein